MASYYKDKTGQTHLVAAKGAKLPPVTKANLSSDILASLSKADRAALQSDLVNVRNELEGLDLQRVADNQSTTPVTLEAALYQGTQTPDNKLVTMGEVEAATPQALHYKGQVKFGATTIAVRDSIPKTDGGSGVAWVQAGDKCEVRETALTYTWDGSAWTADPHNPDTIGDLYVLLFFYGTWLDGKTYQGEVSADIVCKDVTDPANPIFDLTVYSNTLLDGTVTDAKIGNRALADSAEDANLVSIAAKSLTGWLQGIRNNLKYLLRGLDYQGGQIDVLIGNVAAVEGRTTGLEMKVSAAATDSNQLLSASEVAAKITAGNVATAAKLATARTLAAQNVNLASSTTGTSASFDGSANVTLPQSGVTGTLPIANGGTGNTTGLAATATKLATARTLTGQLVNLASTGVGTAASFDGSANVTLPQVGVTGVLPDANLPPRIKTIQYTTAGVITITNSKTPATAAIVNAQGTTVAGTWSALGTSMTFTPTTASMVLVGDWSIRLT